jgi:hypothetical protein
MLVYPPTHNSEDSFAQRMCHVGTYPIQLHDISVLYESQLFENKLKLCHANISRKKGGLETTVHELKYYFGFFKLQRPCETILRFYAYDGAYQLAPTLRSKTVWQKRSQHYEELWWISENMNPQ